MNMTYGKSVNDIKAFMDKYKTVYLYGAGIYAKSILDHIGELQKNISALVVTSKRGISEKKYGFPVMEFGELHSDVDETGFILALPDKYISDVVDNICAGGGIITSYK